MNYASIWCQEVAGDVAPVLLYRFSDFDGLEVPHLLMGSHKVISEERTDTGIRQGTCPELRRVVSREFFDLEISRHMY